MKLFMTDKLVQLSIADLTALQAISRETFADTFGKYNTPEDLQRYLDSAYSDSQLTSELNNENSSFYALYHDNQIVGYTKLNIDDAQSEVQGPDALEVERIYIRPAFKRMGFGRQLMDYAIKSGFQLNKKRVWLGVWERNHAAQKFYESFGFVPFDDHVFTLGQSRQRDILMNKILKK
ncbi:hypothetical protein FD04_GL000525 [Secundilactobacillus odoratitofui DSM 19909 = JCM 15043]|uniref:N-acetyltransferase domain-containing protein n=1 Tax=Secundilactobacillus odoratitofui DSM 19909 = JCM 15043 TaxID=1423776 RepID=A0A0R1LTJ2_9LACO|nr:hypothetical protein FD04_GL000525 [Secundilactobacillus odoratitofui DSM 19909 = JCM 15043]